MPAKAPIVALYPTKNLKEASAISAVGASLIPSRGRLVRERKPGEKQFINGKFQPGQVTLVFEGAGIAQEAAKAFHANVADEELDALVARIDARAIETGDGQLAGLVQALKKLVPMAAVVYARTALDNRDRMLELIFNPDAGLDVGCVQTENGRVMLSSTASETTKRQLLG